MGYITKIEDYWVAPSAVKIALNAMGDANRIQGSVASGAVISCYIDGIPGLELDNGRNPKRWSLSLTPTLFNSFTEKYVYAAIPRSTEVGTMAVIVFPSEQIFLDGTNEAGDQVGSEDYYYVWLHGIISATDGNTPRTWTAACDFGSLGTYEDIVSVKDVDWYSYDKLTQIVTFLKGIVMKPGSSFYNLILGGKELKGVATADTSAYYIDSDTLVATPGYLHANYLNKKAEDTAEEQIGFLKGLWIGVKGLYEITADGMAKFKSLFAESVNAQRVQADEMQSSNFSGDGIADTGWRLTNNANGHSKLTVDELYVRLKAVFESLEVKKEMVTGGNQIFSRAANVICRTDYFDANGDRIGYSEVKVPWLLRGLSMVLSKRILNGIYSRSKSVRVNISDTSQIATIRCYFLAEEGGRKVNNLWSIEGGHDLARCQTFNLNRSERTSYVDGENVKLGNVFWWRKVVGVSSNSSPVEIDGKKYHYFDVSNQTGGYLAGSDLPCAGDEVSQWGNDGNEDRMHLVTIEVDGGVAIKAYEGIYTFDMSKCWYGGNPCKMNLSPQNEYRFTGRSFKIETEYGIRPVPVDIDVDWALQTKSRAEYAETGVSVGQLIIKNYYYDRLPHNGSLWLCLFSGSTYWARYAKYDAGVISYVTEDVFNTLTDSQKLYVRVSGRTGLADNQVCRRMEYTSAEPGTNSAVWHQEVAKGQNGIDAQDVEWVYIRTKTNEAPVILSDSTYTDHNGKTYTADDHLPRVTGNANIENNHDVYECTDDPKGVDDTWKYEWEIKRSKGAASDGHRAWQPYSGTMTLHNNLAESAFVIDTDNDNDQFGTDSNSEVLVQQVRSTSVRLYDGATPQQLKPINVDPTVSGVSAVLKYIDDDTSVPSTVAEASCSIDSNDNTNGIVAITFKTGTFAKSGLYAEITAIDTTGRSKKTVFTVRKVLSGQPGLNPIIYQLAPTQKSFSFSRTAGNALTPSSRSSQVNVAKTEGNTTNILSSAQTGISYQWGFDTNSIAEETGKAVGSSISISNTQAVSHYQVWILLSTGDRETLPIVKDGLNGAMGDTPMQAFQWNQSATTAPSPLPSGATIGDWSLTAPNRPSSTGEYYLWMTQTVKHVSTNGTVTYDTWSDPVRISGDKGDAGEDASDQEFVYIRLTTYPFPNNVTKPADATRGKVHGTGDWIPAADQYETDDWVPEGWSDTALPATENEKYVYAAIRKKSAGLDEDWDDFDEPFLWSNWGVRGIDGDGVQYIYKLFDHELNATERENNVPTNATQNADGEWLPTPTDPAGVNNGWSDDPQSPTVSQQYCYCSIIKKINGEWNTNGNYGAFETLGLWSRFSKDGQSAYKSTMFVRLNTTPTKPANNKGSYNNPSPSDCPAGTSGGSTIYWSDGIPSGEAQIWATSRIFTNDGTSPQQSSWSTPQPMSDTDTFDVEFAVMQTNDAIPATPTANNRHKDAYPYGYEGQVWFDPVLDKYSAEGVLRDFTQMYWRAERECKNGDWGDWTIQRIKGEKGDPGTNGDTPMQAFQWNQSATVAPSPLPSGGTLGSWSATAPNRPSGEGEYFLWMTQTVKHISANGTVTYDTWSDPVRISGNNGTNGEDGTDYEYIYILKTAQYTFPTNEKPANISTGEVSPGGHAASGSETDKQKDDWVPNGWWDNPQGIDFTNKFEYMSLRTKPKGSNTWGAFSEPFIWSHYGHNGMDGDGTEYVFIRTTKNVPPVMDSTQSGYTADEFRPTITAASQAASDTEQAQTTDDPKGTNETYQYEWVAKRNMNAPDSTTGQRTWKKFTGENNDYKMSLWSNYAEDGKNSVRLALDNEHEDFLYSETGLVAPAGGATSQIRLYDGGVEKTYGTDFTATIDSSTGATASINQTTGVLTISGLTADSGKVVVKSEYPSGSGEYYYAEFTGNKTMQDKYDLKVVPNAVAFNDSETWSNKTITPTATRTDLQGNQSSATIETTEVDGLRVYFSLVKSDGTLRTPSLTLLDQSTYLLNHYNAVNNIGVYFELRLYDGSDYRLCDHETVEIAKTQNGNTGQTGPQGPAGNDGEDGVTLLISPASLIVNQDLNNPDNLSNLTQTFVVMVYKGSVAQSVNGIGFTAETVPSSNPTAYKGLFLNSSSQRVGSGNVNGNILTLKQINTYTQGQQTLYYDNFFADLVVNYGNLKTISGRVRIYANLLGTWKQTIEGDVSTEMAQRIAYLYDPNNPNQVVKQETYGEFVRSSTENMSKLSKSIMSRNIMPMTGWTDITGDPYPETGSEHFDPYTQELEAEEPFSRAVALEAGKDYCFSIYTDSNTVPSLYLLDENGSPGSEEYFGEMTDILSGDTIKVGNITYYRHYIVFDISDEGLSSGNYLIGPYVDSSVNLFYRPQLETGSTPTDYGIPTIRYDSEIHQNAEQIDMSVTKNEMEQAGIHINGSNSTIDLVAGRVNFKMPGGGTNTKISIGSDGKLNAVDGNFEGTVRATNFYQQMSVFYEGKSYGSTITQLEDYSYFRYYCKEGFTEGGVTYIQGQYYESYPSGYGNKFERCTYDAEVIDLIPNPNSSWNSDDRVKTCYLPDPKDFLGKVVRVYAPEIGTLNGSPYIDCVVRTVSTQAQNIAKFAKWIYLDSGAIKAVGSAVEQRDVVSPGTQAIYQAIYADGDNEYYWLKLL